MKFFNIGNGYIDTTPVQAEVNVVSVNTPAQGDEIVTLAEAKNYLRINHGQDDTQITSFINAAINRAEKYLGFDIVSKRREVYYNYLRDPIHLFFAPLSSTPNLIATSTYEGETTTLVLNEDYRLQGNNDPQFYPQQGTIEGLNIAYTTLGSTDDAVKAGLLAMIYDYYYNDGSAQSDWKPFLSSIRRHKYYGIR